jgi:hypothetical protein
MGRTIIVGDVHGCRNELDALLDKVAFTSGDRLIFVGDLIARGPDSLGVLDIARRTGAIIVRGNHEEKLLAWRAATTAEAAIATGTRRRARGSRKSKDEVLSQMHAVVAQALREVDWSLLRSSPLYYELPEHAACVVHAGVLPGVPIEQQAWSTLMHIRCVTSRGEASAAKDAKCGALWGIQYRGGVAGAPHIVFGHNAFRNPQFHPWATGIDTACVYGGRLSAMVLRNNEKIPRGRAAEALLVSQPALRCHYDWSGKKGVA